MSRKSIYIYLFCILILSSGMSYGDTNVLTNPGFETGTTTGWSPLGCNISIATVPHSGTYSCLASNRTATWNGPSRSLLGHISNGQTCSISGWARIQNTTSASVKITIRQVDGSGTKYHPIISSTVYDSGWTNLSGFFTLNVNGTLTELLMYFELPPAGVNFYIDDASVVITGGGDWETEANERIEQIRKGDFRIIAVADNDPNLTIPGVNVQVTQTRHHFAFGSMINWQQMGNTDYLNFFKDHFEWAVMGNASKWYTNEPVEDYVTYEKADEIYNFCNTNNIPMRGHCIFWAAENMVQDWVKALSTPELQLAVEDRLNSAVNHFKGKFLHWDVNNEMCNNSYFASRLGYSIRPWMFQAAYAIDPNCLMFLNDYNVINGGYNLNSYKQIAYDLAAQGAPIHGLGVQCHMTTGFSPATVKARFDSVAEVNLPIWVTEFDVSQPDENIRADELENFYRVAFSHPSVEGILMWGFWEDAHWREDCHIVNSDWTVNAAGIRYEAIMDEWTTNDSEVTDSNGKAAFRGFYGTYTVTLSPDGADQSITTIKIIPGGPNEFTIELNDMPVPNDCQQVQDYGYNLPADLDGNCRVDCDDLNILTDYWLVGDCNQPGDCQGANIDEQGCVNLVDLCHLSCLWLRCNDPEDPNCTPNW